MSKTINAAMPAPTILACLTDKGRAAHLLAIARQLVTLRGGRLIGAYSGAQLTLHPVHNTLIAAAHLEQQQKRQAELARANERLFRAATDGDTFSAEWRFMPFTACSAGEVMLGLVRASDLVITDLLAPSLSARPFGDVAVTLALEGGRPVLLLPEKAATRGRVCDRVMIAWDRSRESARAVFDALPLLRAAKAVCLVSVEETGDPETAPGHPEDEMHRTLAHHGIEAKVARIPREGRSTGGALLDHAAGIGATMLVMGIYGHARWREFVFGGATRHVLRHADLPIFMSH